MEDVLEENSRARLPHNHVPYIIPRTPLHEGLCYDWGRGVVGVQSGINRTIKEPMKWNRRAQLKSQWDVGPKGTKKGH